MRGCDDSWVRFLRRLKLGFLGNSCFQNHIDRNNTTSLFLVEFLWVENFGLREEVQAIVIEHDLFVTWETFLIKDLFNTSDYENSDARTKSPSFQSIDVLQVETFKRGADARNQACSFRAGELGHRYNSYLYTVFSDTWTIDKLMQNSKPIDFFVKSFIRSSNFLVDILMEQSQLVVTEICWVKDQQAFLEFFCIENSNASIKITNDSNVKVFWQIESWSTVLFRRASNLYIDVSQN